MSTAPRQNKDNAMSPHSKGTHNPAYWRSMPYLIASRRPGQWGLETSQVFSRRPGQRGLKTSQALHILRKRHAKSSQDDTWHAFTGPTWRSRSQSHSIGGRNPNIPSASSIATKHLLSLPPTMMHPLTNLRCLEIPKFVQGADKSYR